MMPVILAAGRGRRLTPITERIPKPLVPIAGRPLISYCIERTLRIGFDEIVVVIGYKGNAVMTYIDESYPDLTVRYVYQHDRNGTADAVLAAEDVVSEDLLVMNSDSIVNGDFDRFLSQHRTNENAATLLTERAPLEVARGSGVCSLDPNGNLQEVVEKPIDPPSRLVLVGVYAFDATIFNACRSIELSERGEYELPTAINRLVDRGRDVRPLKVAKWHHNINTPKDIRLAEERIED